MRITTKGRVAITAILDIATHGRSEPVPLADIGARQRVSVSYLEHLFKRLREHGFVTSFRGPGGGYRLARDLSTLSVAEVIGAVDCESFDAEDGGQTPQSPTDALWRRMDDQLRDFLRTVTLGSVLAETKLADESRNAVAAPIPATRAATPPAWLIKAPAASTAAAA